MQRHSCGMVQGGFFTEAHTEMLGVALCLPGHRGGGQQSGSQAGARCSYPELCLPAARHPHCLLYRRHWGCFRKLSFPFSKNLHWFLSGKSLLPLFLGVLLFLFFVPEMNVVSHAELSSVDSSCHGDG